MDRDLLRCFIERHPRLFVLTGAGCSTDSGIPDYRDAEGNWKRATRPVTLQAFLTDAAVRRRYWARSLVGWRHLGATRPNDAHRALARLQQEGRVERLVTQNVDRLHQAAGSPAVIDLHGRLDRVRCLGCERRSPRADLQEELLRRNPDWAVLEAGRAPDGDAELAAADLSGFEVPDCPACGGLVKPDVVFFGESVPPARVQMALQDLERADAMLVVGSSLMLYSGYRFAQRAAQLGRPIAAVNLGRTRADGLLSLKLAQPCAQALAFLLPSQPRAA
jgi:NAD-dependent SIR2 family protein deacetylase